MQSRERENLASHLRKVVEVDMVRIWHGQFGLRGRVFSKTQWLFTLITCEETKNVCFGTLLLSFV